MDVIKEEIFKHPLSDAAEPAPVQLHRDLVSIGLYANVSSLLVYSSCIRERTNTGSGF